MKIKIPKITIPTVNWSLFFKLLPYALLAIAGVALLRTCGSAQTATVQQRMDNGQATAAHESATEAVQIQSHASDRERSSEQLSRTNEREIRHAKGADAAIDIDVHTAGLRALCRRQAYSDDPRCVVFKPHS